MSKTPNKNKIKAVIFDMDGLLIDTESLQSKSFELLIKTYGKKPILQKNGLVHDVGTKGNIPRIVMKKHKINEDVEALTKKRHKIYADILKSTKIRLMPGAKKLLQSLKKTNLKTGIASSSYEKFILVLITRLNLKNYFDVITPIDRVPKPKPHPDLYIETAKKLQVKPENCLAIEDSETGVLAGKTAGMKVIAVPTKYTKNQDFSKADKIVKSLSDITIQMINSL